MLCTFHRDATTLILQAYLPLALVVPSDLLVVLSCFPSLSSLMKESERIPCFTHGVQQQSCVHFERLTSMFFGNRRTNDERKKRGHVTKKMQTERLRGCSP